jgi:hypothetical protein
MKCRDRKKDKTEEYATSRRLSRHHGVILSLTVPELEHFIRTVIL